jgi:flagellar FliJ protein
MGGNDFRLEQLLKYRKEVEKVQQLELAEARVEQESAQERLRSEQESMELLAQECSKRVLAGIEVQDLQLYGQFSRRKIKEIREIKESLPLLEQVVQEKRESLMTAAKEKKALEVFKERKMRDLRMAQLGRERAFLDEIAIQGRGGEK